MKKLKLVGNYDYYTHLSPSSYKSILYYDEKSYSFKEHTTTDVLTARSIIMSGRCKIPLKLMFLVTPYYCQSEVLLNTILITKEPNSKGFYLRSSYGETITGENERYFKELFSLMKNPISLCLSFKEAVK